MFSYDCVLAAVLLTAPADVPLASSQAAYLDPLRPTLVQLALDAELVDPREESFRQPPATDLPGELKELQRRHALLWHTPPLAEVHRFPTRKVINDLLTYNRAYRNDLVARQAFDTAHAEALRSAVAETDELYRAWDALRDARCEFYYVTVRRQALQQVRDLVGLHAFYSGELPPHLPYWHFPPAR